MNIKQLTDTYHDMSLTHSNLIHKVTVYLSMKDKALKTRKKQDFTILSKLEKELKEIVTPKESSFDKFLKQ